MTERDMYKQTEIWLYKLDALKARIENLKQQYIEKEMEAEGEGLDYSKDKLCQTYKFSSTTENLGLSLVHTKMMMESLQHRVDMLERSLSMLNEIELEVIQLKYFKNEPWFEIAYKVKQSESTCKRHRVHAINKLKFAIFGDES